MYGASDEPTMSPNSAFSITITAIRAWAPPASPAFGGGTFCVGGRVLAPQPASASTATPAAAKPRSALAIAQGRGTRGQQHRRAGGERDRLAGGVEDLGIGDGDPPPSVHDPPAGHGLAPICVERTQEIDLQVHEAECRAR